MLCVSRFSSALRVLDPEGIPEELMLENPAELDASIPLIAQNIIEIDGIFKFS